VNEVIAAFVGRCRTAVARREILQEFNSGTRCCPQRRYAQPSPEDVVQVLLFGTVVLALADNLHPQQVAIEMKARIGVGHGNSRMVDSEEQPIAPVPLRQSLICGELQDFQGVAVRILEIKRLDAGCLTCSSPAGVGAQRMHAESCSYVAIGRRGPYR